MLRMGIDVHGTRTSVRRFSPGLEQGRHAHRACGRIDLWGFRLGMPGAGVPGGFGLSVFRRVMREIVFLRVADPVTWWDAEAQKIVEE